MNIVLFGFKGCGKTYFGQKLAQAIDRPFIDTDQLLVDRWKKEGRKEKTIPEIYRSIGEPTFRQMEALAIASLCNVQNSVIAVGGGSVLNPANLKQLQRIGQLVFLDASLETILSRKIDTALGPIERLYAERDPLYRTIPAARISVDSLNETEVVRALARIAQQRTPPHGIQ